MKLLFKIMLFIAVSPVVARGASVTSLAILDFQPLEKISRVESHQISEIIRSELIRNVFIRVLESNQINSLVREHQFQKTGLSSESIIQMGKLLKADYLLIGTVSRDKNAIVISARVISARTGENLHGVNIFTSEETFFRKIFDLCDGVSSSILTASLGNTIRNIERMLNQKNYYEAEKRFLMYQRVFGKTPALKKLEGSVHDGLVIYHTERAGKFIETENPSKAYFHARRALVMDPKNPLCRTIYKSALKAYNRYRKEEYRKTLKKAEKLMDRKKFSRAIETLEQYYVSQGSGKIDKDFIDLYREINQKANEYRYKEAGSLSKLPFLLNFRDIGENDLIHYSTRLGSAKEKLLLSIESVPNNTDNSERLVKVNHNVDRIYGAYRSASSEKKSSSSGIRNPWNIAVSPVFTGTIGNKKSPIGLKGTMPGFRMEGSRFFALDSPFSAMASAGFDYNRGFRSTLIDTDRIKSTFNLFSLRGSLLFGYNWRSFCFNAGPAAQIGFIYREAVEKTLGSDVNPGSAGYIGLGIEMQVNYHFSRRIFARSSLSFVPSIFFGMPSQTFASFSLGIGYEF